MLFIGGKSIAFATNHTLNVTAETSDVSHKDVKGGSWKSAEIKTFSWEVSTENLYSVDGEGENYADLFDAMVAKTKLTAVFGISSSNATVVPTGGWTAPSAGIYSG